METHVVGRVTDIIAKALGLSPGSVKEEDAIDSFEAWDSLGHLSILTALDKEFGGRVAKVPGLAKATSVKAILCLLQEHQIV